MRMRLPLERRRSAAYWRSSGAIYQRSRHSFAPGDRDYAATAKHALVHFSRNNKNDAHLTISGAADESHERYEPICKSGCHRVAGSAKVQRLKFWWHYFEWLSIIRPNAGASAHETMIFRAPVTLRSTSARRIELLLLPGGHRRGATGVATLPARYHTPC